MIQLAGQASLVGARVSGYIKFLIDLVKIAQSKGDYEAVDKLN
jgi:hypothetical protein